MSMKKMVLLIGKCLDCPKCKIEPHIVSYDNTYYCLHTGKIIDNVYKIPSWCPLEDIGIKQNDTH